MIRTRRRNITLILCGLFVVVWLGIWLFQEIDFNRTYRELMSGNRIDHVEMLVESTSGPNKRISVVKDSVLNEINRTFQYLQEFTPQSPKVHSVFIVMDVYKKKKCTLHLLKTTYSGWVIWMQNRWYRDDSLISVLDHYTIPDSIP